MNAASMEYPNLVALLGRDVACALVDEAKSLSNLAALNEAEIVRLGQACLLDPDLRPEALLVVPHQLELAQKINAGFLLFAEIVVLEFRHDQDQVSDHSRLCKALRKLAKKVAICAKTDDSGSSKDGSCGARMRDELRGPFKHALTLGLVREDEVVALAVPEVYNRNDPNKGKRGGKQLKEKQARIAAAKGLRMNEVDEEKNRVENKIEVGKEVNMEEAARRLREAQAREDRRKLERKRRRDEMLGISHDASFESVYDDELGF